MVRKRIKFPLHQDMNHATQEECQGQGHRPRKGKIQIFLKLLKKIDRIAGHPGLGYPDGKFATAWGKNGLRGIARRESQDACGHRR